MGKLKRVVVKEEFVVLTGDIEKAIVLNYLIVKGELYPDGWVKKTADEISKETLLNKHKSSILRIINHLQKNGWIEKRRIQEHPFDKTYSYKANIERISSDLQKLGYSLSLED